MLVITLKKNFLPILFYFFILVCIASIVSSHEKFELQELTNDLATNTSDQFFLIVTKLAEGWITVPLLIGLSIKNWRMGLLFGACYGFTALIASLIKNFAFVENQRPHGLSHFRHIEDYHWIADYTMPTGGSFPSGHTTTAFCMAMFLTLITKNKKLGLIYFLLALLVGFSRTILSMHFAIDVLGGAILGGVTTFILFVMLQKKLKIVV